MALKIFHRLVRKPGEQKHERKLSTQIYPKCLITFVSSSSIPGVRSYYFWVWDADGTFWHSSEPS